MTQTIKDSPSRTLWDRIDHAADTIFIWPAVSILLFFSIFPLLISLYLSFARINFVRGGVEVELVGLSNYRRLLGGTQQDRLLGVFESLTWGGWLLVILVAAGLLYFLVAYLRTPDTSYASPAGQASPSFGGFVWRLVLALFLFALVVLIAATMLSRDGRPGTLPVTLFYTYAGIAIQYGIGLGLSLLLAQPLAGKRFFRVVFLLPMMITPVGVAYMIRMMADTSKGPFAPLWQAAGLSDFSWVTSPWGARWVILIGDTWQWTPFLFIVLLAAVEGQSREPIEAARVDGATGWDIFRYVTLPAILPVSTALILIRMIEAFKLVDLPRVMTGGGPGTATESVTMHAYSAWTARDYGGSAAIAYLLLILVTIVSLAFVNLIRQRTTEIT